MAMKKADKYTTSWVKFNGKTFLYHDSIVKLTDAYRKFDIIVEGTLKWYGRNRKYFYYVEGYKHIKFFGDYEIFEYFYDGEWRVGRLIKKWGRQGKSIILDNSYLDDEEKIVKEIDIECDGLPVRIRKVLGVND